jgi:hypothetical protein
MAIKREYLFIDCIIMYSLAALYMISEPFGSEFVRFSARLYDTFRLFSKLVYVMLMVYVLFRGVIGTILFCGNSKHNGIKAGLKPLLLTVPYIAVSFFAVMMIVYYQIKWPYMSRIFEMVTGAFIVLGNYLWLYSWVCMYKRKDIAQEFMYLYCGLFPGFVYLSVIWLL